MHHVRTFAAIVLLAISIAPAWARDAHYSGDRNSLDACVREYSGKISPGRISSDVLWDGVNFCQTLSSAQHSDDELSIRTNNFVFQRSENIVLMWMVVSITLAGVALAGGQLWASYQLAKSGRGALAEGGSVDLSTNKLAVHSSVIGVIVLTISFAFFLVFVLYVYTLNPDKGKTEERADDSAPHQLSSGPIEPLHSRAAHQQ